MKPLGKIISGIAVLSMLSAFSVSASAAEATLAGDLNNDGAVNLLDFMIMKQYIVGDSTLDEQALANADMNSSGDINIFDAVLLARQLVSAAPDVSEEESTITLLGDSIETSSSTVAIDGSVATISVPGVYTITGTLNDGQIIVDVDKDKYPDGKVELSLEGTEISCSNNSPIYIASIDDECVITAKKGTDNIISDGTSYVNADEDSGAIYSKDDLKFKGKGNLTVNGNCADGIVSKNDIKIYNGNITVNAVDDGIRGKDSVRIGNPDDLGTEGAYDNLSVTVTTTSGDGIKSTNSTDEGKGFITVNGGTINVKSYADGFQAEQALTVNGGTIDIYTYEGSSFTGNSSSGNWGFGGGGMQEGNSNSTDISAKGLKSEGTLDITDGTITIDSSDDSLHCAGNMTVTGGNLTLSTADDGMHSDTGLTIGTEGSDDLSSPYIDILTSYEGVEGVDVTVNSGSVMITASDDGYNAAGGTDNSGSTSPGGWGQGGGFGGGSQTLVFNGGFTYVNAGGDGLDSNGTLTVNDGYVFVSQTGGGNSPIDCDTTWTYNGGVVVAGGSSDMFSESIPQTYSYVASSGLSISAGTTVSFADSSNNVIATMTFANSANAMVMCDSSGSVTAYTGGTVDGAEYFSVSKANENMVAGHGGTISGGTQLEANNNGGGNWGGGGNPGGRTMAPNKNMAPKAPF